ncbi:hypothetical protein CYCD_13080 [Tenuifilaceae bacterium CYCD]|nr:hypothetical protein CYCD_13080 [Tenuifilaceae bacterium CYCD]
MDAGDYIYIIIAIVLAVINAVANKKKKEAAKRKAAVAQPEEPMRDPADILQDILMGKVDTRTPESSTTPEPTPKWFDDEDYDDAKEYEQPLDPERPKPSWAYEAKEEPVQSIEYQQPVVEPSEAKLYPTFEVKPLDVADNAKFTPIDVPDSIVDSIAEFNYDELNITEVEDDVPDMIFDHERAMAMAESEPSILDDFDPKKAIVYSEIMTPKYLQA